MIATDKMTVHVRISEAILDALDGHRKECCQCSRHWQATDAADRVGFCKEYRRIEGLLDAVDAAFRNQD